MANLENKDIKVKSLYKALKLLDYFCEGNKELSVTELSKKSGMLMSSVHNMLSTFTAYGFLQRDQNSNRYSLGKKFLEFSHAYNRHNPAQSVLKPLMKRLSELTDETIFLAVPYGTNIIYLDSIFPQNSTSRSNVAGITAPIYCTSIGKAILSKSPESLIEEVLNAPKKAFTENTIVDATALRAEIELIKEQNYAVDNMEHEFGIKCVGACVELNNQLYGISISGPSLRFLDDKIKYYAQLLNETLSTLG